jgi:ATP-binding cassette subfamily C protein
LYDNRELSTLNLPSVRRQLGVVLQGGHILTGDIASNILAATGLGLEAAWRAAEAAGIACDIRSMPMGIHTQLSEDGTGLSGGQRQRLLIARALVHNPRLLFLDEATSALDSRTQAVVTSGLEQLGVTRIVIAHRLSTVRHADRICVLEVAGR